MSFHQLKLRTRLGAAFIALVVFSAAMGGFTYIQLSRLNGNVEDLASNRLPSINTLAAIRSDTNSVRRAEADHLLSDDAAEWTAAEGLITAGLKRVADRRTAYEPLISFVEEKNKYVEFSAHYESYLAAQKKLLALSGGGDKTADQAKRFYRGESRQAFAVAIADIGSLIDINSKGADDSGLAARATFTQTKTWLIGLLLIDTALACLLAVWTVRSITRQLGGEPADAARVAQAVAGGHLASSILLRQGDCSSVMAYLKAMQESLSKVVDNVRQNSEAVATASAQIAQGNNDLSSRTEQQASALEETAASMEELSSTVKQNADNARQANQLAMSASTVAVQGGEVVSQVVDTMKGINDSSKKISDIIGVIDGIAFQTNILALNAAVEAARAGEQGRGFAVVASEVRSLAGRSADAAKEIKSLINASVERVAHGSALVDRAGTTMTEVVTSIRRVTDIMGEISAASIEQSTGVAQIGEAVSQMDRATQQNAALVEESAAAAESLRTQAQQLVQTVAVFTLGQPGGTAQAGSPTVAKTEAREPARATNANPASFTAKKPASSPQVARAAAPSAPAPRARPSAAAAPVEPAKTGTDGWDTF